MMAGPSMVAPAAAAPRADRAPRRASRRARRHTSCHWLRATGTLASGLADDRARDRCSGSAAVRPGATASTDTASTTSACSASRKPKRRRCAASNPRASAAASPAVARQLRAQAVSVPSIAQVHARAARRCVRRRRPGQQLGARAARWSNSRRKRLRHECQVVQAALDRALAHRASGPPGPCRRPTARRRADG